MKTLLQIANEVERAKGKFPDWPTDPIHAAAIVNEEIGELNKAILQQAYEPHKNPNRIEDVRTEAIHAAAMLQRFIEGIEYYRFWPSDRYRQHIPCAACDRGDWQLGHAEHCPNT